MSQKSVAQHVPTLTIDPTNVTTFAGNGTAGYNDGTGATATFYYPQAVAIDPAAGNLYLPSYYNNQTLRQVTIPAAVVTTLAGGVVSHNPALAIDGTGAAAEFLGPIDAETDAAGNIYVLDFDPGHTHGAVRKVTPAGVVTTIWENNALFMNFALVLKGIAVAPDGSAYISFYRPDGSQNQGIINATTNTIIYESTGPPLFFNIDKFAIDGQGDFYIPNIQYHIYKFSGGVFTILAGSGTNGDGGDGGLATAADIGQVSDIEVDALGNVYILTNQRIRKISPSGYITAFAGNPNFPSNIGFADGNGTNAKFNSPTGIKMSPDGKNIYVADASNHRIRKLAAPVLTHFSTITGTASASQYYSISGLYLTNNATLTAPAGYEISLSENSGYAVNLAFVPQSGSVVSRNIYVRLAASTLPGTYNGNIVFSSPGAIDKPMPVTGVVAPHQLGGAFNFNVGGYTWMPTNNFPTGNSNYSIECWIKSPEDGNKNIIRWGTASGSNTGNGLALLAGNRIDNYWGAGNELIINAPTINDNNWHHIAATYNGIIRSIYMDGILLGSDNPGVADAGAGVLGYIGTYDPYSMLFNGNIDELRIFNKALTQAEIIAKMNCELPAATDGLSAYYKFNQGTAFENNTSINSFTDASGNGNNTLFLYGYTLNGTTSNFVTGAVTNGQTCSDCTVPAATPTNVSGQVNVCPYIGNNIPLTYSISADPNASGYQWTLPPTVTLISGQGTNSITVTIGSGFISSANKVIKVKVLSPCGNSSDKLLYLAAQLPNTPQPIVASTSDVCPFIGKTTYVTYTIPKVASASQYFWNQPAGTTINHINATGVNDTTVTLTFSSGFSTALLTVYAYNDCGGASSTRSLTITRNNPATPGLINGSTNACPYISPNGIPASYSVAAVANATKYTWAIPAGATDLSGQNTNNISFTYPGGFTGGTITVTSSNGCGTSGIRPLAVGTLNPATPGVIDVIQLQACPARRYSYALASMPSNASTLQWTIPAVGTLVSGQGTTSITVDYPSTTVTGSVTVSAINNCATSGARSTNVKLPICPPSFAGKGNEVKPIVSDDSQLEDVVSIYPNPAVSAFQLQVTGFGKAVSNITILDAQGRVLYRFSIVANQQVSFGEGLKSGIYFIEIQRNKSIVTKKLIKL